MYQFKTISVILLLLVTTGLINLSAQEKKTIYHGVYDGWMDIKHASLSNDGQFAAFEINPQKGDGNLFLFNSESNAFDTFSRGIKPIFGANSNFLVFTIKPEFDTVRKAKLDKVKKDKLPKDSVGVLVFETNTMIKYPKVKHIAVPEGPSDWIAVLLEKKKPEKSKSDSSNADKQPKKSKKKKDNESGLLVLLNPISGDSISFDEVSKFAISKNGSLCAFVQPKNDSIDSVSVHIFETASQKTKLVYDNIGFANNISCDEKGKQIAFTYSSDTAEIKSYRLYYLKISSDNVKVVQDNEFEYQGEKWSVSEHGKIYFNEEGTELYFGTNLKPGPKPKDTLTDEEKVSLDIWNWKDPYLQPHQLKQLVKEKKRTYKAVYHIDSETSFQLANPDIENVSINKKAKGKYALGTTYKPYRKEISWDASRYKDVYLIDRSNGKSQKILDKAASFLSFSPLQKYVAWYNITDSSWYCYDVVMKTSKNLTHNIEFAFYNELDDVPNEARPYGLAGWTKDEMLVVYDRYDLWMIDPASRKEAVNLTGGEGRKNKIKLRYLKLDRDLEYLPKSMLLSAFNESNKQAGYYQFSLKNRNLKQLVFGDNYYGRPKKAKEADKMIWTKESFTLFPDLYYSSTALDQIIKISEANPQQSDFNWGTTELVKWTSFNGDSLQGILVKPEDFDTQKKYPMLVYFYERSSDRLNRHYTPKPIRSTINWTYYASNGYIIFVPDIKYKTGYPGPSAFNCIVSGTQAMCNRYDFIDRDNLGIQGQSWGGYQTAYIITQTDMYKAAMAGAPVSNMTSAYGGIRWGTGISRAFQYEESQSRIGATLWERRDLYILNSPLFFADQIQTPLLMMHNDNDGAVPWYQGIEFFNALRRLDKPVWMLVYNKAPHNLKRRADMVDLTIRMQQFFDHYLKGAPEPVWMETGIPALDKGHEFGFELIEE